MNTILVDNERVTPSKIICIGRNYVAHIHELGNEVPNDMVIFMKPNSAISSTLPSYKDEPLHYESEICFIYHDGKFTHVGFGIDLTKRELQSELKNKGLPWERAKAFNGSAVFSSFVRIDSFDCLAVKLMINRKLRQYGETNQMIYKPTVILKSIQKFMTLVNGDIVMTGTPKGVGKIEKGDVYSGSILRQGETIIEASWHAQ